MADREQTTEMLRAEAMVLLSQARAQAVDLQRALGMALGNPVLQSRLGDAAAKIAGAVSALSQALDAPSFPLHAGDLLALEAVVEGDEARALVSEAAAQAGAGIGAGAAATAEVAAASADTRHEVESLSHDLFEQKIFDPYLHFSSPEDEAEFRKREAEARKYISDQLARGTPEGNLNAGGGELGYMLDAHAHGAGDSPEFMPRWNALVEKTQRQRDAMKAAGQSTEEFDRHLDASVRRFLKARNLSDTEIDRRLAGPVSPLDAVKPYLGHESHIRQDKIDLAVKPAAITYRSLPPARQSDAALLPTGPLMVNLDAVSARLKSDGVKIADRGEEDPAHGLTISKPADRPGPGVAG